MKVHTGYVIPRLTLYKRGISYSCGVYLYPSSSATIVIGIDHAHVTVCRFSYKVVRFRVSGQN